LYYNCEILFIKITDACQIADITYYDRMVSNANQL